MRKVNIHINIAVYAVLLQVLSDIMNIIFTYEKYPELNIEKTTNRIEGLFK